MNGMRKSLLSSFAVLALVCGAANYARGQEPQEKPKPEAAKPEAAKSESTKPQSTKSESGKTDAVASDKAVKPSGVSTLHIEITAGDNDKPVDSASVYVRYPKARMFGREKLPEMDLKTNREGMVKVPNVPRGKVLVQVMAPGWRTYGRWFDLDQPEQTIKIKLEKPTRWY